MPRKERSQTLLRPISVPFKDAVKAFLGSPLPRNPDDVKGSRAVNPRTKPQTKRKGRKKR